MEYVLVGAGLILPTFNVIEAKASDITPNLYIEH